MAMTKAAAIAVILIVAGCGSTGTPVGAGPSAARPSVAPSPSPTQPIVPAGSPSAGISPEPAIDPAAVVGPGEPWIAYQWVAETGGDGVFLVRPDGTGNHQLVPELDGNEWHPAWSPDGSQLAFIHVNPDDTLELWIVDADGANARRLATCLPPCNNMIQTDWIAADPGAIYVNRDGNVPPAGGFPSTFMLSRFDLASGAMRDVVVREDGWGAEEWRISRDGTKAAFVGGDTTVDEIARLYVVDLATDKQRVLTNDELSPSRPDWLPDGRIVFDAPPLRLYNEQDGGPGNLYVVESDGTHLEPLTRYSEPNTGAFQPRVRPDGTGITITKLLDRWTRPMAELDLYGGNERYLTPNQLPGTHTEIRPLP